jgi:hypothetical protein
MQTELRGKKRPGFPGRFTFNQYRLKLLPP